jgi:hypothetical protein
MFPSLISTTHARAAPEAYCTKQLCVFSVIVIPVLDRLEVSLSTDYQVVITQGLLLLSMKDCLFLDDLQAQNAG